MTHLVFVYGTLMKGYANHDWLLLGNPDAKFVGRGVAQNLALYNVTQGFPGVIREQGASTKGEVYEVGNATLRRMDNLESEGHMYLREKCVVHMENGELIESGLHMEPRNPASGNQSPEGDQPGNPDATVNRETRNQPPRFCASSCETSYFVD